MSPLRLLLVDDHEVVRIGLRSLLERQPSLTVIGEARTGTEAVAKALELRPDVVVMDIRLPGLSGIDACREIVEQLPDCQIIMLTSYADGDLLFDAIRAGAAGYVLKQIGSKELIQAIETVGRGESPLDPALTRKVFERVRRAARTNRALAFASLTNQELQILGLVCEGMTNREIAEKMAFAEKTVRNYVSRILNKLGVANRAEAAAYAARHDLPGYLAHRGEV